MLFVRVAIRQSVNRYGKYCFQRKERDKSLPSVFGWHGVSQISGSPLDPLETESTTNCWGKWPRGQSRVAVPRSAHCLFSKPNPQIRIRHQSAINKSNPLDSYFVVRYDSQFRTGPLFSSGKNTVYRSHKFLFSKFSVIAAKQIMNWTALPNPCNVSSLRGQLKDLPDCSDLAARTSLTNNYSIPFQDTSQKN